MRNFKKFLLTEFKLQTELVEFNMYRKLSKAFQWTATPSTDDKLWWEIMFSFELTWEAFTSAPVVHSNKLQRLKLSCLKTVKSIRGAVLRPLLSYIDRKSVISNVGSFQWKIHANKTTKLLKENQKRMQNIFLWTMKVLQTEKKSFPEKFQKLLIELTSPMIPITMAASLSSCLFFSLLDCIFWAERTTCNMWK